MKSNKIGSTIRYSFKCPEELALTDSTDLTKQVLVDCSTIPSTTTITLSIPRVSGEILTTNSEVNASILKTTTGGVLIKDSTTPSTGQVLTASSIFTASWQTPAYLQVSYFRALTSALPVYTIPNDSQYYVILFADIVHNVNSGLTSTSSIFTAPVNGLYSFTCNLNIVDASTDFYVMITANTGHIAQTHQLTSLTTPYLTIPVNLSASGIYLTASDWVKVQVINNGARNFYISTDATEFYGCLIRQV